MSSPTNIRIAQQIRRRARIASVLSYLTAFMTAGIIVVFVLQAGLFQMILPAERAPAPEIALPSQVSAGASTISGIDNENLPYEFSAETAVQDKEQAHLVHLETLRGSFRRPQGQVFDVAAQQGLYDSKNDTLDLMKDVNVVSKGRFGAVMEKAHVTVKEKTLTSDSPVNVTLDNGSTVVANGLKISDDGRHILFLNGVKAKFTASGTKGDAQP